MTRNASQLKYCSHAVMSAKVESFICIRVHLGSADCELTNQHTFLAFMAPAPTHEKFVNDTV